MTLAIELTYGVVHVAIKISILLLYRSVFTLQNRRFRIAWFIVLSYNIAFLIASIVASLLQCLPISYGWQRIYGHTSGRCINIKAGAVSTAALSTAADVALLILPIPTLLNLQMPYKQKLGLCGIFLLGGL